MWARSLPAFILVISSLPMACNAERFGSVAMEVCFLPRVEVQPARPVRLGDIAKIQGPSAAVEKARSIIVAIGPLPGKVANLFSGQLRQRIQAEMQFPVKVSGAENTTLVGKSIRFKGTELAEFAKAYLESQLSNSTTSLHEVEICRVPGDMIVAAGESCQLKARLLSPTLTAGPKSVAVDIVVDDRVSASTSVGLVVHEIGEVLVSTREIRQGEVIGPDNTSWEIRDITKIKSPIKREYGDGNSLVVKRTITAGTILTSADVAPTFVVRRGETVMVTVKCGRVTLHTTGEAKQDGTVGDLIRVRPPVSSEDIQAKVLAPGIVTVER